MPEVYQRIIDDIDDDSHNIWMVRQQDGSPLVTYSGTFAGIAVVNEPEHLNLHRGRFGVVVDVVKMTLADARVIAQQNEKGLHLYGQDVSAPAVKIATQ